MLLGFLQFRVKGLKVQSCFLRAYLHQGFRFYYPVPFLNIKLGHDARNRSQDFCSFLEWTDDPLSGDRYLNGYQGKDDHCKNNQKQSCQIDGLAPGMNGKEIGREMVPDVISWRILRFHLFPEQPVHHQVPVPEQNAEK
jgi:hypothetical protein